jgi:hypothetical protein
MSFHKGEVFGEEVLAEVPATHRVIAKVACNLHLLAATRERRYTLCSALEMTLSDVWSTVVARSLLSVFGRLHIEIDTRQMVS